MFRLMNNLLKVLSALLPAVSLAEMLKMHEI